MNSLLRRMLDESEFLSEFGVRALSRRHLDQPYRFPVNGQGVGASHQTGWTDLVAKLLQPRVE